MPIGLLTITFGLAILFLTSQPKIKSYIGILKNDNDIWKLKTTRREYNLILPDKIIDPEISILCRKLENEKVIVRAKRQVKTLTVLSIKSPNWK